MYRVAGGLWPTRKLPCSHPGALAGIRAVPTQFGSCAKGLVLAQKLFILPKKSTSCPKNRALGAKPSEGLKPFVLWQLSARLKPRPDTSAVSNDVFHSR